MARIRIGAAACLVALGGVLALAAEDAVWTALLPWLLAYLAVAALVGLLEMRLSRRQWARHAVTVTVLDPVVVYAIARVAIECAEHPALVAGNAIVALCVLVVASSLSLQRRLLYASACVSAVLTWLLLVAAGVPTLSRPTTVVLFLIFAVAASHSGARVVRVVRRLVGEQLRRANLQRYFSPTVVERLAGEDAREAAGETREVSIVFADVVGFTHLTERMTPTEVVDLLNEFLAAMTDVVFRHEGTLDKFLGDGLLAYFGAPLEQPDHAVRAVRCGREMLRALDDLNARRVAAGKSACRMGIGIHSGSAVVGSIGHPARLEFTIVGSSVNLASRVEALTRDLGRPLLVTAETWRRLPDRGLWSEQPARPVAGFSNPVRTWAIPEPAGDAELGTSSRRSL
jgi:adenylate cyclase